MPDRSEALIHDLKAAGVAVEMGTFGYRIRAVARLPDGRVAEALADDTYTALRDLADQAGLARDAGGD